MMFGCFRIKPWTFAGKTRRAKVIECYDGDTITIAMWVGWQRYSFKFRLYGIDAPEIRTKNEVEKKAAIESKTYQENMICGKRVKIVFSDGTDKYGRLMGTVYFKDQNINQKMITANFAKPYDGGKKQRFV